MDHKRRVTSIQEQMKLLLEKRRESSSPACLAILHGSSSNSTRSKGYNQNAFGILDLSALHHVVSLNTDAKTIVVEPRVTMEELVAATLPYGLVPPVIPEFKSISVGGAISGCATESSGCRYGTFHDTCLDYEILCGNGEVVHASPSENPDIFHGFPGSYGSLGPLLSCTIQLIPACSAVELTYHVFHDPIEALRLMRERICEKNAPDFLDGLVFSKDLAVIIEGKMLSDENDGHSPFSMEKVGAEWYYQHVRDRAAQATSAQFAEKMDFLEYLFRYDTGAFWMGSYVFNLPLVWSYVFEGLRRVSTIPHPSLGERGYKRIARLKGPNYLARAAFSRWFSSKNLWKLEHATEKWVHGLMVIQDFCLPEDRVDLFLKKVLSEINIFPLWLCPIKAVHKPEIFCPHAQKTLSHVINVGIYGLSPKGCNAKALTRTLENLAIPLGGKKVLYGRSYYTQEEFWSIYTRHEYELLRKKMHAQGVWKDIADKVLSE
jgi:hypothetical protein